MKPRKEIKYDVRGDTTILYILHKNKEIFEVLIDTEDLDKLLEYSWNVGWRTEAKGYYVCATVTYWKDNKRKQKTVLLHRFLTNAEKGQWVDRINHNKLDNRKSNLRITSCKNNSRHRKGKNCNNKSGYRNVAWIHNKWCVQLQVNGKNTTLGKFDDVDEAGRYAEKMRQKYYGEFAGVG